MASANRPVAARHRRHIGSMPVDPSLAQLLNLSMCEQPANDENNSEETATFELPGDDDDDAPKRKKGTHDRRRM